MWLKKEKKKLYSRLVLVTRLFPIEMIKTVKTQNHSKKEMHKQSTMNGIAKKKIWGPIRHKSFLSPSMLRGLFCQIIMTKVSEGHQVYNELNLQNTKMEAEVARRGNLYNSNYIQHNWNAAHPKLALWNKWTFMI